MAKNTTITGKAFEYATLVAFQRYLLSKKQECEIELNNALETARSAFASLSEESKQDYTFAAEAAVRMITPLEPNFTHGQQGCPMILKIQTDRHGEHGDVRDVVFVRNEPKPKWEIGISCKHNHDALKHPRVTESSDFGLEWIGVPCSDRFFSQIQPTIDTLIKWADEGTMWRDHCDKRDLIYVPIIQVFIDELKFLCDNYPDVPKKLLGYFFGVEDFYKVISHDRRRVGDSGVTEVSAFNIKGTLGEPARGHRSTRRVRVLKMPTRLIEIGFKTNSQTTLVMTFDEGWSISMRLHSADNKVKTTGLKWDVKLVGTPSEMHKQEGFWCAFDEVD